MFERQFQSMSFTKRLSCAALDQAEDGVKSEPGPHSKASFCRSAVNENDSMGNHHKLVPLHAGFNGKAARGNRVMDFPARYAALSEP